MMMNTRKDNVRTPWRVTAVAGMAAVCMWATLVRAEPRDRKFVCMLAAPIKSLPRPLPTLPNPNAIYDHYFDRSKPSVDSFAEYWHEISYGNVTVSGDVFGWVELPWPVLPQAPNFNIDAGGQTNQTFGSLILPFNDLNNNGKIDQWGGEVLDPGQSQMVLIDYNGGRNGTGAPPAYALGRPTAAFPVPNTYNPSGATLRTPGLIDMDAAGAPVWTPGERFLDEDDDGRYDALLENWTDGQANSNCIQDGLPDSGEFCDLDSNGKWGYPEPFEDFLIIYNPAGFEPEDRWIALDPSGAPHPTNPPFATAAWARQYILDNYPGNAAALIARCGDGFYEGPDRWIEASTNSSKLVQSPGTPFIGSVHTPQPDTLRPPFNPNGQPTDNLYLWDYTAWWNAYWTDRGNPAAPPALLPWSPPSWETASNGNDNVPNMVAFDPTNPSFGTPQSARLKAFNPNKGGDKARSGLRCALPPFACPAPAGQPQAANFGDGTLVLSTPANNKVMPDELDSNNDSRPDAYDGPAEFDDLPSSLYHARTVSGLGDGGVGDMVNGGDLSFGEVTGSGNTNFWGQDRSDELPGSAGTSGDGIIPPGGPGAFFVHGSGAFDGANVMMLEYLTWRREAPTSSFMKADFTLDGLLDMGEVRDREMENYVIDARNDTPNDGGPSDGYPFNRRRMTEDVVAALDPTVDWDTVIFPVTDPQTMQITNFVFSSIFLPAGMVGDGLAAGGRGLFQLPAPAMDLPVQIVELPGGPASPLIFSDFATGLDGKSETGQNIVTAGFAKELMSHEFLHVWEGYPDLYDYDEYSGGIINRPVGIWDIMSGGWVHPAPPLKEAVDPNTGLAGSAGLGLAHEPWLHVTDLTTVLTPGKSAALKLTDYAFDPDNAAYFFTNPDQPGEKFYFWRDTRVTSTDPTKINFNKSLPGDGIMIMHTDFQSNLEGFPLQQRVGSHFTFSIVQADGLHQLENGENSGDGGDPFNSLGGAARWDNNSDPNSRWYGQLPSGLSIQSVISKPDFSTVTFLWQPRLVPELHFQQPPGGIVVNGNFVLSYDAFDRSGGTLVEFYFDNDAAGYDGTAILPVAIKPPGNSAGTFQVPMNSFTGDGTYYFYARLVPAPGADGSTDPLFSPPHTGPTNDGAGRIDDALANTNAVTVDINNSKLESWTLTCADDTVPDAEKWDVVGTVSGNVGQATTGVLFSSASAGVQFQIVWTGIARNTGVLSNTGGVFKLTDTGAGFVATTFKKGDTVRIVNGPAGTVAGVYTITSVPDASTLILASNAGDTGGVATVSYRVHSFTDGAPTGTPDTYSFLTTGKTPYSLPIIVANNDVTPQVYANMVVTYPLDASNPQRRAPLAVHFDASASVDELGQQNAALTYQWAFGDGSFATGVTADHIYTTPAPLGVTATLTVTNPTTSVVGTASTIIIILPPFFDPDGDGIDVTVDNCPNLANPTQTDTDGDTVGNACDNCPFNANPMVNGVQPDINTNGLGDACDPDMDGDGVPNAADNCPTLNNASQSDINTNNVGDACDPDIDGDGRLNPSDNCPTTFNPNQQDADQDGIGDSCDLDVDNDGVANAVDNCSTVSNPSQADADGDNTGDACDTDKDGDGFSNAVDNCPSVANATQADADGDHTGDACDLDIDNDGLANTIDNCPLVSNQLQQDADGDHTGDACDNDSDGDGVPNASDKCPTVSDANQADADGDGTGDACDTDKDGDGVVNGADNCPAVANANQADIDKDTLGDSCDPDSDGDGLLNAADNCPLAANQDQADLDHDGIGDSCDADKDGDTVANTVDNCPLVANANQKDTNHDGVGDSCEADQDGDGVTNPNDNCPLKANANQLDGDGDGIGDPCDNCAALSNANQADFDHDGVGDACDPKFELQGCPANIVLSAQSNAGSVLFFSQPTVIHPAGPVTLSATHAPGTVFPIGDTVVSFTAVDPATGASRSCSFTVTVKPLPEQQPAATTPPVTTPAAQTTPAVGCFPFGLINLAGTLAYSVFVGRRWITRRRRAPRTPR